MGLINYDLPNKLTNQLISSLKIGFLISFCIFSDQQKILHCYQDLLSKQKGGHQKFSFLLHQIKEYEQYQQINKSNITYLKQMQKNRRRSVYIQKDPQKQRSYSMIEESGLGEKNSNFIKEPIKKGEILENYNLIIKNKAYEGLSQIERWRARDFGCLFDMLKTFQKTLQLRQQQHQQLTKTYKQLRSENQRQQAELEEIMERNKFMQVQNSKIISNLIEVRQEYVKGNRGFQTKVKPSSSIECSNLFGKHYENIQLTQSELKNIKHLQSFQNQRSRSRFISLQGPLESKIYNQPQEDPEILTIPNILESFKPESDGVNELQPQLLSRARGASLYDPKKPSFNKASSFDQSEIKLETQIMKLNNVLMSKISSNPETKSSHLFLQEKKAPQVKKDNHFNRWQHK